MITQAFFETVHFKSQSAKPNMKQDLSSWNVTADTVQGWIKTGLTLYSQMTYMSLQDLIWVTAIQQYMTLIWIENIESGGILMGREWKIGDPVDYTSDGWMDAQNWTGDYYIEKDDPE